MPIVNTASACGLTPQYRGLEALHQALGPRGFSALGFPCNQFGSQEPGDAAQIEQFCASNYAITFPMFAKIDVNGSNAHRFLLGKTPKPRIGSVDAFCNAESLVICS